MSRAARNRKFPLLSVKVALQTLGGRLFLKLHLLARPDRQDPAMCFEGFTGWVF